MSLSASGIASAIAALSITGVDILDLDEVPMMADVRATALLFPDLNAWGGEMVMERQNVTMGGTSYWRSTRTLGYVYLHCEAGEGRGLSDHTIAMSDNRDAICEAVAELTSYEVVRITSGPFEVIADPSGNEYFGFRLGFSVWEQVNA